jgi:hypothetical protein
VNGVTGVTELDAEDSGPVMLVAFVPLTLNVYAVLAVRPDTVIGLEEPVPVIEPGVEVTV